MTADLRTRFLLLSNLSLKNTTKKKLCFDNLFKEARLLQNVATYFFNNSKVVYDLQKK